MFYVNTEKERSEWVDAIKNVANSLTEQDQHRGQIEDIEMGSIAEDELLDEKFSLQGTSTGKVSGKKKVVSFLHMLKRNAKNELTNEIIKIC